MPVFVGKAVPNGLQKVRWIREEEHIAILLRVWIARFVHQLFASLWSMQSKQLAVGSKSVTCKAEYTEAIPLETPNCFPEDMKHLVPLYIPTWELSIGELQPAEHPSYHQHKHRLGQWLFGTTPITFQHVFECSEMSIQPTKVCKPDQTP